jgi:predicted Zn-dependent protease
VLRIAAGAVLLSCTLLTAQQVTYWQDGATLFEHTIAVTKDNACAYANAGLHRARAGDSAKAIEHFQASLRIQPDQNMIWREFGRTLVKIHHPKDAVQAFRMAVQYTPTDMESHYQLGVTLQQTGAMGESIAELGSFLRDVPRSAGAHYYLARALEATGQHAAAMVQLRQAAQLAPGHPVIAPALQQVEAGAVGVAAFPEL